MLRLIQLGFQEKEILDWPMDKFHHWLKAAISVEKERRTAFVCDVAGGVTGALTKGALEKYLKEFAD